MKTNLICKPETLKKHESEKAAAIKESAIRRLAGLKQELKNAEKDGESSGYINWVKNKIKVCEQQAK